MTDDTIYALRAAISLLKQDIELYNSNTYDNMHDSSYSRGYDIGAVQASERAIRYIEHALSMNKPT